MFRKPYQRDWETIPQHIEPCVTWQYGNELKTLNQFDYLQSFDYVTPQQFVELGMATNNIHDWSYADVSDIQNMTPIELAQYIEEMREQEIADVRTLDETIPKTDTKDEQTNENGDDDDTDSGDDK